MASLRARLLAVVLVLAAIGLILVGAITYAEQRSFLLDRIDSSVRAAPPAVAGALAGEGIGPAASGRDHDRDRRGGAPS
jgi:two-component system, OmpR family, sensor kinase